MRTQDGRELLIYGIALGLMLTALLGVWFL